MASVAYICLCLTAFLAVACIAKSQNREATSYVRGCYYTNWAQYRPENQNKYDPTQHYIPGLCTHIFYAFANMTTGFQLNPFEWNDEDTAWSQGYFSKIRNLKKQQPDLKILLSFGGWTFSLDHMPLIRQMASSPANRATFINSVVKFIRRIDYDGFDIDWEYPEANDKADFSALVRETRAAFDQDERDTGRRRLLLTSAVSADYKKIDAGYDIPSLSKNIDYLTIMAYDFHGAWEKTTGLNSPLYDRNGDRFAISDAANEWARVGMPKSKLLVGLATYGRGWKLADPSNKAIGAPASGPNPKLPSSRIEEGGVAFYYEVCDLIDKQGYQEFYDEAQQSPYVVGSDGVWIGYDNLRSFNVKLDWVKQNGFAGAFVWTLDQDDFKGTCASSKGQKYPLLTAIKTKLGGAVQPANPNPPPRPAPVPNQQQQLTTTGPARPSGGTSYVRGCYYTNWAQYRPENQNKYDPTQHYVPGICTHIFYAFANMTTGFQLFPFEWNDEDSEWGQQGYFSKIRNLKQQQPDLKIILSFGGWTFSLDHMPLIRQMASSPTNRATFINSVVKFIRRIDYDGFDIDWEYPEASDKADFSALVKEMRAAFDQDENDTGRRRLLLTSAVSADYKKIDAGYDIARLSKDIDYLTIMSYDFHGAWEMKTGFNSPLYDRDGDRFAVSDAANEWARVGMPKSKLLVGVASYGRGWKLADPSNKAIGALASGPNPKLPSSRIEEGGVAFYYEVCDLIEKQGYQEYYDDAQQSPYVVGSDGVWIGYDNVKSINVKLDWVKDNGFAGAFIWTLDQDDFKGTCASSQGQKYPLLTAIKQKLGGAVQPANPNPPPRPTASGAQPTPAPTQQQQQTTTTQARPSGGSGPFQCPGNGIFPDPNSCKQFYNCWNGTPYSMPCPPGLEFNAAGNYCDWPDNAKCKSG